MLQELQLGEKDYRTDEQEFEQWLAEKTAEKSNNIPFATNGRTNEVVTIPVVVHVIHNGEALGVGSNIPDGQINSQIETLNQDFRRLNPDASETLSQFVEVAADTEINFSLARRDPEGLPTTGIVRIQGSQPEFSIFEDNLLKSQSFWPSEDYLNIWVVNLSNDLLGYAQFPVSSLEGLAVEDSNNRLTDGVVVNYEFFGTGFNTDPFSQGRTATHEIGHFLGLRHVWGDGGCSFDDFCADTPQMGDNSSGCPINPDTCPGGLPDMYQNYMDFTDDDCMNLFTTCQSARMRTVLEQSPRRKSLLVSKGAIDAVMVENDLGIRQVISPEVGVCSSTIIPELEVRNYGTNEIVSYTIALIVDGDTIETYSATTTLSPLSITSAIFQSIEVTEGQEFNYEFVITEVNGVADGNPENDRQSLFVQIPFIASFPEIDDFEDGSGRWMTRKFTGGASTWQLANAPLFTSENTAYQLPIFNSPTEEFGNLEMLLSPVLDLEKVSSAELNFQYAYSLVPDNFIDRLTVAILTECGVTFDADNVISSFDEVNSQLATSASTSGEFVPAGSIDWQEVNINLNQFLGLQNVQVALIAQNGGGNNIYVDELEVLADNQFRLDAKVVSFSELPDISCRTFQAPIVEIKNFGIETITSLDYEFGVLGNVQQDRIENINILPGESQDIAVGISGLTDGGFIFGFTITAVNGQSDDDPSDNTLTQVVRITESEDILPLREQFEQRTFEELEWFPFSLTGPHDWTFTNLSFENGPSQTIGINAFDLPQVGTQNWLVSPKLDLSQLTEASLQFDLSYANRENTDDRLEIFVSSDCGRSFNNLAYSKQGADLAVTSTESAWIPQSSADWVTESVDLSAFAGSSEVLVAFVFTNDNGNNLYLDNFNFFVSSDPVTLPSDDILIRVFPNPSPSDFNITFNLQEREQVFLRVVDMMGNQLLNITLPDVLNQTYSYDVAALQNGLYLVQAIGETFKRTERVVVFK